MSENDKPISGFLQPAFGSEQSVSCNRMKGKTKRPKVPGFMRAVLSENIRRFMDQHYKESRNRPLALSKDAGVSLSTVQRMLDGSVGATLDNIEAVAAVFNLSTYQLLLPSLSVTSPQIVQGATKEEERLYRLWRRDSADVPHPTTSKVSERH